jgi:hypothetical protein
MDLLYSRRHEITSLVLHQWVQSDQSGSVEISMAPHFFDGTYRILEEYVIEGAKDLISEEHNVEFSKLCADDLTNEQFMAEYMEFNKVVLVSGLIDHWRATKEWCMPDPTSSGELIPDMGVLKSRYGDSQVEVEPLDEEGSYNRTRVRMLLSAFSLDEGYVKDFRKNQTEPTTLKSRLVPAHMCFFFLCPSLCLFSITKVIQLYICLDFRSSFVEEAQRLIPTPRLFVDDWLNEYANTNSGDTSSQPKLASDYHFMYLGGKGSSTHLHADVLGSYSWSANVCGQKTWRFLHPKYTYMLRDVFGRKVAPDFGVEDDYDGKYWQFPLLPFAPHFKVVQEAGEVLFVPSEWYHTVVNNKETLSINANWFNRHNLIFVFNRLRRLELSVVNEKQLVVGEVTGGDGGGGVGGDASCSNNDMVNTKSEQYGKLPFDMDDFLSLLEWKLSKAEQCSSLDLHAIKRVCYSILHDAVFREGHRNRSKSLFEKCEAMHYS